MPLSPSPESSLRNALAAQRSELNGFFRARAASAPKLQPQAFLEDFWEAATSMESGLARLGFGGRADAWIGALFRLLTEEHARGLAGPVGRIAGFSRLLTRLVTPFPTLLFEAPADTLIDAARLIVKTRSLGGNAVVARLDSTAQALSDCPSNGGPSAFRATWAAAAWKAGLPQYRKAALEACLSQASACAPLLERIFPESINRPGFPACLASDPWACAADIAKNDGSPRLGMGLMLGAFEGSHILGGRFEAPVRVGRRKDGSGIQLTSGKQAFSLHADSYGIAILPLAEKGNAEQDWGNFSLLADGKLAFRGASPTWVRGHRDSLIKSNPSLESSRFSSVAAEGSCLAFSLHGSSYLYVAGVFGP